MTDSELNALAPQAVQAITDRGILTVSGLQRDLGLGFADAQILAQLLREKGLAAEVERKSGIAKFLNRVTETAVFFRDMYELGEGGHNEAIKLLRPWPASSMEFRILVNQQLFNHRALSLTEVAAAEMVRLCPAEELPIADVDALAIRVMDICAAEERPINPVPNPSREELHARAVWRYARYLRLDFLGFADRYTDAVEWFVQREWIPTGRAVDLEGGRHPQRARRSEVRHRGGS